MLAPYACIHAISSVTYYSDISRLLCVLNRLAFVNTCISFVHIHIRWCVHLQAINQLLSAQLIVNSFRFLYGLKTIHAEYLPINMTEFEEESMSEGSELEDDSDLEVIVFCNLCIRKCRISLPCAGFRKKKIK